MISITSITGSDCGGGTMADYDMYEELNRIIGLTRQYQREIAEAAKARSLEQARRWVREQNRRIKGCGDDREQS